MVTLARYTNYCEEEILPLYQSVGWTLYAANPAGLRRAFAGSLAVWAAYVDGKLVGICRIVGDGESILYVQDLLVRPSHQRQGIGRKLLQTAVAAYPHVRQKLLLTDDTPETKAFYRAAGFSPAEEMKCVAFIHQG